MVKDLKIKLVHYNTPNLGAQWQTHFEFEPNVEIVNADITDVPCDALVSPGNSFGFMDGGLNLAISNKFGWGIQAELQRRIKQLPLHELLVGQAEIIENINLKKLIICAPTMRVPGSHQIPESTNAYLAMKAILITCISNAGIKSVAIPGLCTGTGRMPFETAAYQMYKAYCEIIKNEVPEFPVFIDAVKQDVQLRKRKM